MEKLQIQPNDSLSINDLVALREQGFSVLRSAHVGNLSPYNLSLADAGIPLLLVDHNVTGVDRNYFPELILARGERVRVAEDGLATLRARTADGRFLDELHIAGINEALPNADVFTNSEYLRRNADIAGEIAALAVKNCASQFERIVRADGTTQKIDDAADLVGTLGIMQLSDDPRAEKATVLLPNMVDIIANFVIEQTLSERDVQYHISGPDMIRYIGSMQEELNEFYDVVRQRASFGSQLPDTLTVQLIPAASARFATTAKFGPELSGLFAQLEGSKTLLAEIAEDRKTFFGDTSQKDPIVREAFVSKIGARKYAVESEIVARAEAVPGIFVEPRQIGFTTQYDLIRDGGLFVASENKSLSFGELAAVSKGLVSLRKRLKP